MEANSVINLSLSQAESDRHAGIFLLQTQHHSLQEQRALTYLAFTCTRTGNCKLPAQTLSAHTCLYASESSC